MDPKIPLPFDETLSSVGEHDPIGKGIPIPLEEEEEEEAAEQDAKKEPPTQVDHARIAMMMAGEMNRLLVGIKKEVPNYSDIQLCASVESSKLFRETAKRLFSIVVTEQINRMNRADPEPEPKQEEEHEEEETTISI